MRARHHRRTFLTGLATATLATGAGCVSTVPGIGSSASEDTTDRTIKLGLLGARSGDLGAAGQDIGDASRLPIAQLREADVPVEFEVETVDTETDARTGVLGALELVEAGYPAINGALASGVTLRASQQVLIPYRTVCCSPASTSPTITTINDGGFVFRTAVSDAMQAVVLAERASEAGHGRAATVYVNNDYGYQLSRAFSRAFRVEHGGTVTSQIPYEQATESATASYEDEIGTALADGPDVVVLIGYTDSGAQLLRDVHAANPDVAVLVTDGMRDTRLPERVEHSIDHVRGTAPVSGGPGESFFVNEFEDRYDASADSTPFNASAYDASAVLLLANAFAGRNDGEAVRAAVRRVTSPPGERIEPSDLPRGIELAAAGDPIEYVGASSDVEFDENGDVSAATFAYWSFEDASIETIAEVER
ncbi:ABC transporter substrate-binding protein [Halovivax gelatinilyticus]|uniref:ABC transporter substrate-binding protein n=1 Tax=Halovivax gelatinilyticus TaxID=2961597 RepID=UPI0020CA5F7F|nr:ABC transporter substrate-binding protein [Halovivax gelatinilyticus]